MPSWPEIIKSGAPWLIVFLFLTGFVTSLRTGKLRTNREYQDMKDLLLGQVEEAKTHGAEWRQLVMDRQELERKRDEQLDSLLEGTRMVETLVRALPAPPATRPRRGPAA